MSTDNQEQIDSLKKVLSGWQKKRAFLEQELVTVANAATKFELLARIEECEQAIARLTQELNDLKHDSQVYTHQSSDEQPEVESKAKPTPSSTTPKMNILHLSDLHFNNSSQARLWSSQLVNDLQIELDIKSLDALIISGDITNRSAADEYQAAEEFLRCFRQDFPLTPEQIVIVPGNHDLSRAESRKSYTPLRRDEYDGRTIKVKGETKPDPNYAIDDGGKYVEKQDEEKYKERFAGFSDFYQSIKNQPYPLDYGLQYTISHFPEKNLLILGLNSAWQLDHEYTKRASINMDALTNALNQIRRNPDYQNCLKVAVWHHPLNGAGEDKIKEHGFMQQLAVSQFQLFLHGHIHKADSSLYRYDMSREGRKLNGICAGTFGAHKRELVTGKPWQYNLLKFAGEQLTVETRRRDEENGAWMDDAIWRQGRGQDSSPRYSIQLVSSPK